MRENLYAYFGKKDMQHQKQREVQMKKRTGEPIAQPVLKAVKVIISTLVFNLAKDVR